MATTALPIGFRTGTNAAGDWFRDNVDSARWQRLGAVLWIDHFHAGQIIDVLAQSGFTMEYEGHGHPACPGY